MWRKPVLLLLALLLTGGLVDLFLLEPGWIKINRLRLSETPNIRLVHFTDLHYKGDKAYLQQVVERINELTPDIVCFTGDLVEDDRYLTEALEILADINSPVYGVPGNHDYWSGASFETIRKSLRATGGDWLLDTAIKSAGSQCLITGRSGREWEDASTDFGVSMPRLAPRETVPVVPSSPGKPPENETVKRILLTHYPATVDTLDGERYNLILAGHSHGGQIRLPFIGALITPYGVGPYDAGLYSTPAGPLYVNVGIGTFFLPMRFFCRPEITLIEL